MSTRQTLEELERQCQAAGVKLIYDDLRGEGGLCRLHDRFFLVINRRAAPETRARLIAEGLARLPTMSLPVPEPSAVELEAAARVAEAEAAEAKPAPEPDRSAVGARSTRH